jgi:hypothetical protein
MTLQQFVARHIMLGVMGRVQAQTIALQVIEMVRKGPPHSPGAIACSSSK